jgi:hypothetical protein
VFPGLCCRVPYIIQHQKHVIYPEVKPALSYWYRYTTAPTKPKECPLAAPEVGAIGAVSHAALANELAGEYFERQKDSKMAQLNVSKSESDYRFWGAIAKLHAAQEES